MRQPKTIDNVMNIHWVCQDCGTKHKWKQFELSTWNEGHCDICEKDKSVTQFRDFYYGKYTKYTKEKE